MHQRLGLSRGVLMVDFLLCSTLTVLGRISFRFLDDVKEKRNDKLWA